jgi:diacylglycerol kinase (ATP)
MNPFSGRGRREARLAKTRKYFQRKLGSFDLVMTRDRDDISNQTRLALHEGVDQIVALGGDGTVNAIVNGFFENGEPINPKACLVVTGWGTGSDYFKTVKSGSYLTDWKTLVTEHNLTPVDLGEIEFGNQKKLFINMASVGLSAFAAQMKNKNPRWIPRTLSYIAPSVAALVKYRVKPVKIVVDDQIIDSQMMALFVGKGLYAGGGMKLGGGVSINDGAFDLKLFDFMSLQKGFRRLPRLYSGRFDGIPEIRSFVGREIRVECEDVLPVESDGEIYGTTNITIRMKPKAIQICWPRD